MATVATFEEDTVYDRRDARGLLQLTALRRRTLEQQRRRLKK